MTFQLCSLVKSYDVIKSFYKNSLFSFDEKEITGKHMFLSVKNQAFLTTSILTVKECKVIVICVNYLTYL